MVSPTERRSCVTNLLDEYRFWYSRTDEEYAQMPGFRELNGIKHPGDLVEAKRLLEEAEVPEGLPAVLPARNCCGYPDMAVQLKEQLHRDLGWDITLRPMEPGAGFDAYWNGEYQFMVQASALNNTNPDGLFGRFIRGTVPQWVGGGRGRHFAISGIGDLIDRQMREPDREKRKVLIHEIAGLLQTEGSATANISWVMRHQPVDHRIKNYPFTYHGTKWEHVWCDPAC